MRMGTRSESNPNSEEFRKTVVDFFCKQKEFKQNQAQFGEAKALFYGSMEDYFSRNGIDNKVVVDGELNGDLVVTRVQSSKVEFNPDKLEKALGKELASSVIHKRYEITDMSGLVAYLKSCGVDPKVFKSFLNVSKTVDTKELDRLEELGKVTTAQVKGCYTIKKQSPYFTVGVVKG